MCLTCWIHERKHKLVKRYAEDIKNRLIYAMSVMSEVLSHQLHDVAKPNAFDISLGLLELHPAANQIKDFMSTELRVADGNVFTSATVRLPPLTYCLKTDVVLIRSIDGENLVAGDIWFLSAVDGLGDFALVSLWGLESFDPALGCAQLRKRDQPTLLALSLILTPAVWTECAPEIVRTLIPYQFEGLRAVAE